MFQVMVLHHSHPEHADEFVAFMYRVIDATKEADGLIEFTAWRDPQDPGRLFGFSRWESPEAFQQGLPLIMSLAPERKPEWSPRPDEVFTMISA